MGHRDGGWEGKTLRSEAGVLAALAIVRHPLAKLPGEKGQPWNLILPSSCQKPQILTLPEKLKNVGAVLLERSACPGDRRGSLELLSQPSMG